MADTLLRYSLSTTPLPLQVSTTGAITIVASNPGGHSDQPAQDYVAVTAIVFDFGVSGSGGAELTTATGASLQVTPPTGWAAPAVTGLQFKFTPPASGANVFPSAGLQFTFGGIPVNATIGTVVLQIAETASSPGNPAEPDLYPPRPLQVRDRSDLIGKFPADFAVGELIAMPPNVPAGSSTTLSWDDSPGAVYELDFGASRVTQHANGTALQPSDTYPDASAGDAPLALQLSTVFTLTATCTPPGGSAPAIYQRQVSVGVNALNPEIGPFTVTPPFVQVAGSDPTSVKLEWTVKNGRKPDCVAFTIMPSQPAYPDTGSIKAHIKGSQVITLTAYGAEGTTPDTRSHALVVARGANISAGIGAPVTYSVIAPDGTRAFFVQSDKSVVVIGAPVPDISQWRVIGTTAKIPALDSPERPSFAQSSYGEFLLCPLPLNSQLGVFVVSSAPPAQWPLVVLNLGMIVAVAATSDGKRVLVGNRGMGGQPSVGLLTINGSDPKGWTVTPLITFPDDAPFPAGIAISPRGDYAFLTMMDQREAEPDQLWVMDLTDPDPANWRIVAKITEGLHLSTSTAAISPDGRTGLVGNFNALVVLDLSATDPSQWRIAAQIGGSDAIPSGVAFSAGGDYAFASYGEGGDANQIAIVAVSPAPPAEWPVNFFTLPGVLGGISASYSVCTSALGTIALVGNIDGPVAGKGSVTVISVDKPQTPSAPPPAPSPA